jgi:hypothetical protein
VKEVVTYSFLVSSIPPFLCSFSSTAVISSLFLSTFQAFFLFPFSLLCVPSSLFIEIPFQVTAALTF